MLFRIRLFPWFYDETSKRAGTNVFSSRVELRALSAVHQYSMGLLSKLCWWWPVFLSVGDCGKRQLGVGLKAMLKHMPLPLGLFACALRRPISPFEKTFNICTGLGLLSGCVQRRGGLGLMSGLNFVYIHCRGRLLLVVWMCHCVSRITEIRWSDRR